MKTFSGFLQVDIDRLLEILSRYTKPTFEELCQAKKIDIDGIAPKEVAEASKEPAKEKEPEEKSEEEPEDEEEIEDDDDFFANSGVTGAAGIKTETPNQTIANIIAGIDSF